MPILTAAARCAPSGARLVCVSPENMTSGLWLGRGPGLAGFGPRLIPREPASTLRQTVKTCAELLVRNAVPDHGNAWISRPVCSARQADLPAKTRIDATASG